MLQIRLIRLFKIKGAKREVFCCLRCCIFEAKILFCVQSFGIQKEILLSYLSSFGNYGDFENVKLYKGFDSEIRSLDNFLFKL